MSNKAAAAASCGDVLSELGRVAGSGNIEAFLGRHSEIVTPATVEQLGEMVRQRVRVDVEEALRLSEAAIAIATKLSDRASLGRGFRAMANALWFKGNCRAAAEFYDRAAADFEAAGMPAEVGRTLSSSIQTLVLMGEYERARAAAEKARQIFLTLGDDWRRARLELNVANIDHRQDRFAEALAGYERAYEELVPYKDSEGIGVALHNMAVCLIMLNDFDRAFGCYQRVAELCERNGMPLLALQADYNIAYLYFLRGDYALALDGLCRTRERCRDNGDAYHAALCGLDQAEIYLELNLTSEAARAAEEAKSRFGELGMAFETARSVANLAIATHRQADSTRALELFAEAKAIFARENNHGWQALIDFYQAMVLFELRQFGDARQLSMQAKAFFHASRLDRRETACDLLLARLSLETGEPQDARARCETALERIQTLDAPLLGFEAHLLLGHAERMAGSSGRAYQSYNDARSELETLRTSVQGEELKISFLKDKTDVYESLVGVCLDQSPDSAAETVFQHIQQAKSRSLAEMIFGRSRRPGWSEASGGAAEKIRTLRRELNWFYHRIDIEQTLPEGISVERISRLRAEARRKEDEFMRAVRELEGTREWSGAIGSAVPMEPAEIMAALHPEAAIIEYFQCGADFIAAVMDAGGTQIVRLASVDRVGSRMRMLDFQLSRLRPGRSYPAAFEAQLLAATQNHLRELYNDLIAPLASLLKGRHLIVAPHGILHYVPFHALLDGSEYLIDRFTISFAPSASIYAMCHRKPANNGGPSLLMGVQDQNAPSIEEEIHSVAAVVREPQVFLGGSATSGHLRSIGPVSRMIHIATHGFFRRDNPMFSSVRLADVHMSLYDLYELRLPVELLTLSGCGTGLNMVAAGDELLGLTRGLLCAGAQTVLLSLWDVHDRTTAEFMASFYTHLQREREKGAALRAAMLETRARRSHPYFWAPFVLVGKAFDSWN